MTTTVLDSRALAGSLAGGGVCRAGRGYSRHACTQVLDCTEPHLTLLSQAGLAAAAASTNCTFQLGEPGLPHCAPWQAAQLAQAAGNQDQPHSVKFVLL